MSTKHGAPADIATAYLTAFYDGDHELAASLVSDDFRFDGPFLQVNSKAAFFEGAAGLLPIVRGHTLRRQWADGDEVCSVYDVNLETPTSSGTVLMSEWHTVRHGKLAQGRVVFDTRQFNALVGRA
jgi:ketosteroid isomerase-like protein